HPVRMRPSRAGQAVDQSLRPVGLEVASDLVELLTRIAHLAGAADAGKVRGAVARRPIQPERKTIHDHQGQDRTPKVFAGHQTRSKAAPPPPPGPAPRSLSGPPRVCTIHRDTP